MASSVKKRPRVGPKKPVRKPEAAHIRYLFYVFTLALGAVTFGSVVLLGIGAMSMQRASIASTVCLSLFFPFAVFSYLLYRGKNIDAIVEELKISRKRITYKMIGIGIVLFFAVLLLEAGISEFQQVTGVQLPTNVSLVLGGFPVWVLAFTVLVAPINEEILFRAFLVPRIGIVPSAILFGILHAGYGSIAEIGGAFIYGLIAGYTFKKTDSLYPSIIGHILVNALAVVALIG